MAEGREDRTQPATARRLERARASGQVALSREVSSLLGMAAATALLLAVGPALAQTLARQLASFLADTHRLDPAAAGRQAVVLTLVAVAPLTGAVLLAGVAGTLLQTQGVLRLDSPMPDLSRLNPRTGLNRLYGAQGLVEQAKSLAKCGLLAWAGWHVLLGVLPLMRQAELWLPGQVASHTLHEMLHLMVMLLAAHAVITAADMAWVRYRHLSGLRMSREEVKQDTKDAEGNPQIKSRLRQMRHARARQRMMAAVPKATVVVTNPTHYAIALTYERGRPGAPRVVAKGMDEVAARIRDVAREHRVPLVVNPPLARALYPIDLDAEIPAEHFKAVAEIIAYVWRLRGRSR